MVRKKQKEKVDTQTISENTVQENLILNDEKGSANNVASGELPTEDINTTVLQEVLKREEEMQNKYNDLNDKYLRIVAEFDNYRKRTLKERMELIKFGGEDVLKDILPVVDDLDRAIKNIENSNDIEALKTGILLIYSKFQEFLKQKGLKEIEAMHMDFDIEKHEAVTKIPSPSEELKGKVVDVVKKGYLLHDKVLRYAQVVVGE